MTPSPILPILHVFVAVITFIFLNETSKLAAWNKIYIKFMKRPAAIVEQMKAYI